MFVTKQSAKHNNGHHQVVVAGAAAKHSNGNDKSAAAAAPKKLLLHALPPPVKKASMGSIVYGAKGKGEDTARLVKEAIDAGFRHIATVRFVCKYL